MFVHCSVQGQERCSLPGPEAGCSAGVWRQQAQQAAQDRREQQRIPQRQRLACGAPNKLPACGQALLRNANWSPALSCHTCALTRCIYSRQRTSQLLGTGAIRTGSAMRRRRSGSTLNALASWLKRPALGAKVCRRMGARQVHAQSATRPACDPHHLDVLFEVTMQLGFPRQTRMLMLSASVVRPCYIPVLSAERHRIALWKAPFLGLVVHEIRGTQ